MPALNAPRRATPSLRQSPPPSPIPCAPAQWMVAAFGLSALWRVFEAVKAKATPAPQEAAFLALAAWAFYKQAEMPVALAMMAAHIVSSALA